MSEGSLSINYKMQELMKITIPVRMILTGNRNCGIDWDLINLLWDWDWTIFKIILMKFLKDDSGYVIPWFGKVGHFLPRDEIVFGIKSNLTLDNIRQGII